LKWAFEIAQIPGVGEFVEDEYPIGGVILKGLTDKVGPDEASPTCHKNPHG
jgi:hypothetical protein